MPFTPVPFFSKATPLSLCRPPKHRKQSCCSHSPYGAGRKPGPRGSHAVSASPAQLQTSRHGNSECGTRRKRLPKLSPPPFFHPRLSYRQPLSLAPFLLCCVESGKEHTGVCLQPKHTCSCPQLPHPCKPSRAGGGRRRQHSALVDPFQAQSAASSSIHVSAFTTRSSRQAGRASLGREGKEWPPPSCSLTEQVSTNKVQGTESIT